MARIDTLTWKTSNHQDINCLRFSPADPPRAVICIVHGLGEHSGRYTHVGDFFANKGWATLALDLPGHGKSSGKRGHVKTYSELLDAVEGMLTQAHRLWPGTPVFLYGHSFGGNIVANYVLRRKPDIRGAIITGAWLRLAFEPPKFKVALANVMKTIYPAWSEGNGLIRQHLSRDPEVVRKYENDPLVHDRITAGTFAGAFAAAKDALEMAVNLPIPMLVMHGGDDRLTASGGSKEFAEKAGKMATYQEWPGLYHEIHNEPEKEQVLARIAEWIAERLNG